MGCEGHESLAKSLARPARFELTTSAFGGNWFTPSSSCLWEFSVPKSVERNAEITRFANVILVTAIRGAYVPITLRVGAGASAQALSLGFLIED
jgi:hypothetical protein